MWWMMLTVRMWQGSTLDTRKWSRIVNQTFHPFWTWTHFLSSNFQLFLSSILESDPYESGEYALLLMLAQEAGVNAGLYLFMGRTCDRKISCKIQQATSNLTVHWRRNESNWYFVYTCVYERNLISGLLFCVCVCDVLCTPHTATGWKLVLTLSLETQRGELSISKCCFTFVANARAKPSRSVTQIKS